MDLRPEWSRRDFIRNAGAAGLGIAAASHHLLRIQLTDDAQSGSATLRVGDPADIDTLNPLTSITSHAHLLVYDRLMVYDADLNTVLSLAKSRTVSPDGKTTTFVIHDGATFHDGTPVTSADVKFSYDIVHQTGLSTAAGYLTNLVSTTTPDPLTFVATYSEPPATDAAPQLFILPKHIWGSIPSDQIATYANNQMIGSGPFKFAVWKKNVSLEFQRFDKYWGKRPGLESVAWVVYQDEPSIALALKQGDIQSTNQISSATFASLQNVKNVKAQTYLGEILLYIGFNLWHSPKSKGNPLLRDKTIRQAMEHAIDKQKLVELTLQGRGTVANTLIMPAYRDWHLKLPKSQLFNYDPEKASAMLEKAGYKYHHGSKVRQSPAGRPLEFRIYPATSMPPLAQSAELIQPMMEKVGIRLNVTTMSSATLGGNVYGTGDYDLTVWDVGSTPDPSYLLRINTTSAIGTESDTYYSNPAYDKLVAEIEVELNFKRRQQLVNEAQKLFYDDVPYICLMYPDALEAHRTDTLAGWLDMPGGVTLNWSTAGYLALKPKK